MFAYISHSSIVLSYGLIKNHIAEIMPCMDKTGRIKDIPEKVFSAFYVEDFKLITKEVLWNNITAPVGMNIFWM